MKRQVSLKPKDNYKNNFNIDFYLLERGKTFNIPAYKQFLLEKRFTRPLKNYNLKKEPKIRIISELI